MPPEEKGIKFCPWFWTWPPVSSPVLLHQIFTATLNSSALEHMKNRGNSSPQGHPANEGALSRPSSSGGRALLLLQSPALPSHAHEDFSRQSTHRKHGFWVLCLGLREGVSRGNKEHVHYARRKHFFFS